MIDFLRKLLRRLATVAALLFGALLAALFAALTLAAALAIGASLWLGSRFGLRAARREPQGPEAPRGQDVIDVEMREIGPDDQAGRPGHSTETGKRAEP
jgi:hypothetical protein